MYQVAMASLHLTIVGYQQQCSHSGRLPSVSPHLLHTPEQNITSPHQLTNRDIMTVSTQLAHIVLQKL